ncbi:uncharacterized protein LOC108682621 isoform X2 [Hyalella azteca]|nr:uncharacterized protein LOC108682621 isoform X2 [Hyalella azteca]
MAPISDKVKKSCGRTPGGRNIFLVNNGQTIRMQGTQPPAVPSKLDEAASFPSTKGRKVKKYWRKPTKMLHQKPSRGHKFYGVSSSKKLNSKYGNASRGVDEQGGNESDVIHEDVGVTIESINELGEFVEDGITMKVVDNCTLDINAEQMSADESFNAANIAGKKSKNGNCVTENVCSDDDISNTDQPQIAEDYASEEEVSQHGTFMKQEVLDASQELFFAEPECQLLIKKEWIPQEGEEQEVTATTSQPYSSPSMFAETIVKQEHTLEEEQLVEDSDNNSLQLIHLYVGDNGLVEDAPASEPAGQLLQSPQFLLDDQKLTLSPVTFLSAGTAHNSTASSQSCALLPRDPTASSQLNSVLAHADIESAISMDDFNALKKLNGASLSNSALSLHMPCPEMPMEVASSATVTTHVSSASKTSVPSTCKTVISNSSYTSGDSAIPSSSTVITNSKISLASHPKPARKITIRSIQRTPTSNETASKLFVSREVKSSVASKMCQTNETGSQSSVAKAINVMPPTLESIDGPALEGSTKRLDMTKDHIKTAGQHSVPKVSMIPNTRQDRHGNASRGQSGRGYTKVDKEDPRSRLHYVKYMKKDGKTIKKWECGMCGREFIHQYTLMRHLPTHTDERNFHCDECGKSFRQMSTLSQHRSTHSQFRPYVCDVCQKTFTRVSTLISHKKLHDGVKPHVCHVCGKAFHQKGNLKNHMFIHTNERPYKCHQCGRGFNQASNLHSHKIRAHSDNSPLVLSPAELARVQSLSDSIASTLGHQNPEPPPPPLQCPQCPLTFGNRATMKRHEISAHSKYQQLMPKKPGRMSSMTTSSNVTSAKRCKVGSVRMVEVPGGDEAFQQLLQGGRSSDQTDQFLADDLTSVLRLSRPARSGLLIPAIRTAALASVVASGKTPFALLKPAVSAPVVVRVALISQTQHALLPATAAQLREASQFSVAGRGVSTKAVQIKIPVVATVVEKLSASGEASIEILAPDNEVPSPSVKPKVEASVSSTSVRSNVRTLIAAPNNSNLLANVRASINTITPRVVPTSHATQMTREYVGVDAAELPSGVLTSQLGSQDLVIEPDMMVESVGDVVLENSEDVCSSSVPELLEEGQLVLEAYAGEGGSSNDLVQYQHQQEHHVHLLDLVNDQHQQLSEPGVRYLCATGTPGEFEMVAPDDPRLSHIVDHLGRLQPVTQQHQIVSEESADVGSALASLTSAGHEDPTSLTAEGGDEGAQFSLSNVNNSCRITLTDSGSLTIESAGGSVSVGGDGTSMAVENIAAIIGALQRAGLPVQLQSNTSADPASHSHMDVADDLAIGDEGSSSAAGREADCSHMAVDEDDSHMAVDENVADQNFLPSSAVPELVEDAAHAMLMAEESVITHPDLGPDDQHDV